MTAYRLHRLGWTSEEVAGIIGVARQNYERDFLHQFPELENDAKKLLDSGIPHLDAAEPKIRSCRLTLGGNY